MILVFVFIGIIILLMSIIFITISSTIRVDVKKLHISNTEINNINKKIENDYVLYLGLYLFNKIKLINKKIDKDEFKKLDIRGKIKRIDMQKIKNNFSINKGNIKLIKKLNIKLEKFNLNFFLGTEDVIITSGIITFLSIIISLILPQIIKKYNSKDYYYKILPIYNNGNLIQMDLMFKVHVKIINIIYVLYILLKSQKISLKNKEKDYMVTAMNNYQN